MATIKPIFSAPPHRTSATDALAVWFTEPWGMTTQFTAPAAMTISAAEFIIGAFADLTRLCSDPAQRYVFVHDWSLGNGYEPAARSRLVGWGRDILRRVDRVTICMGPDAPALVRMGLSVGATAMTVIGMKLEVLYDAEPATVVSRIGLTAR